MCFVLAAILMLLCCACVPIGFQKYACKVQDVESVQIVRLDKYVREEYRFEHTVLSQIDDFEPFVNRLNNVKRSANWGDPYPVYEGSVVIRINYLNGDFDLLHQDAQLFNRNGKYQSGYVFFNDEQFEALISDYMA